LQDDMTCPNRCAGTDGLHQIRHDDPPMGRDQLGVDDVLGAEEKIRQHGHGEGHVRITVVDKVVRDSKLPSYRNGDGAATAAQGVDGRTGGVVGPDWGHGCPWGGYEREQRREGEDGKKPAYDTLLCGRPDAAQRSDLV